MHAPPPYHPPMTHPMPPKPRRKRAPWLLIGGISIAGLVMLTCVVTMLIVVVLSTDDTIAEGVSMHGINVGGLSLVAAEDMLVPALAQQNVSVVDGVRRWDMTYGQLGLNADAGAMREMLEDADKNATLSARFALDLNATQRALVDLSAHANINAIPGRDAQNGRSVDVPANLNRIRNDPMGELGDGTFELTMLVVEPPEIESLATYTGEQTIHVVQKGQELGLIAKAYGVDMNDILALNDIANANLIYPGQELTIPASGVYVPSAADAPAAPLANGKSIVVDTSTQRIYAYEDGQLLRTHLVSTGTDATPTLKGDYNIYVKLRTDDMSGPDYFVPQVPWTMYYYRGYAIHGAYWHNSFGRQMSHGCVNLPVQEAEWFYNWAEVGTLVRVI